MADECRLLLVNEETEELMRNELIDEELADQIVGIIDDGYVNDESGCEEICSAVIEMLKEIGIESDSHEAMIKELEGLKLVKKVVEGEKGNGGSGGKKKVKKVVKKNGK